MKSRYSRPLSSVRKEPWPCTITTGGRFAVTMIESKRDRGEDIAIPREDRAGVRAARGGVFAHVLIRLYGFLPSVANRADATTNVMLLRTETLSTTAGTTV